MKMFKMTIVSGQPASPASCTVLHRSAVEDGIVSSLGWAAPSPDGFTHPIPPVLVGPCTALRTEGSAPSPGGPIACPGGSDPSPCNSDPSPPGSDPSPNGSVPSQNGSMASPNVSEVRILSPGPEFRPRIELQNIQTAPYGPKWRPSEPQMPETCD